MSQTAILKIGSTSSGGELFDPKTYSVIDYQLRTARKSNVYSPDSDAYCDKISFAIVAPKDGDMLLYEWYINQSLLSGTLTVTMDNPFDFQGEVYRNIHFESAQCFSLAQKFDIDESLQPLLIIEAVFHEMTIDDVSFKTIFEI